MTTWTPAPLQGPELLVNRAGSTRPCTCDPCGCVLYKHLEPRLYGWCPDVYPGCHVHGPCAACGEPPVTCTCAEGPYRDPVVPKDVWSGNPDTDRAWR